MPTLKWLKSEGNYYYFKDAPVHISSITLNKSSISLTSVGQTEQLTATVAPDDAVEKHVRWSSSDITVATVSQTGLVTCVTPGSCTITASCDGVSATCEVLKEKYFEVNLLIVGGGGSGGDGSWNGSGGGGGDVYCGTVEIPSSLCVTVGAGGDYWGTRCGGQSSIVGSDIEVIANGGCVGSNNLYAGGDPECCRGGNSGAGCKGGLPYNDNSGYTKGCFWAGGGGGGAGGNGCDAEFMIRTGGNGGPGICGYGGGGGGAAGTGATIGCGVDGGGNGNGGSATNYGGGGGGYRGSGCQGVVDICYTPGIINSATGGDCCYTCDGYCVHRFTSSGTFCIIG